jgi:hypothetical protein
LGQWDNTRRSGWHDLGQDKVFPLGRDTIRASSVRCKEAKKGLQGTFCHFLFATP